MGCAIIPAEAPELSVELGNRISAIEDANITLLNRFFDMKRSEVDRFVEEEWVPAFAEKFFSQSKISKAWNIIVSENDKNERLKFIVMVGPKLQEMINKKRLELIGPLDILERRIEKNIREEYNQVRSMNNTISSFLFSAAKVSENRNRYLEMAGVTEQQIGQLIDQTDDAVSILLKRTKDVQGKVKTGEEYLKKLRSIRDSIK